MSKNTFIAPLGHLGILAVDGEDAANFLHNQLTNDVLGLNVTTARLAGYCSPKGRLLATLQVWQSGGRILLLLPRDILPAIQKRLQMFVMRSKVKLADVSDSSDYSGIIGLVNPAADLLAPHFSELPSEPYAMRQSTGGVLIRQPDAAGLTRYLWVTDAHQAQAVLAEASPATASLWRWSEIQAGIPQITQATQEQFVPQMLNFEIVGGVNFRKGCYPGQEIVARSQYLGKFKRRMMLATVDASDAAAGTEIFSASDPDQPCGMLVNAERGPDATLACLVEIKLDAMDQPVHLGTADGPLLAFASLPYTLPAPGTASVTAPDTPSD